MDDRPRTSDRDVPDFFVSYTHSDKSWAEWIGWTLEDAGYRVKLQAWDFEVGSHFVTEMHDAVRQAARTIAVLSDAYKASPYATQEWQAAWASDPDGRARRLIVVRVEECVREGLLAHLVGIDLYGTDRNTARRRLLAAVTQRSLRPTVEPTFPAARSIAQAEPLFPPTAVDNGRTSPKTFDSKPPDSARINSAVPRSFAKRTERRVCPIPSAIAKPEGLAINEAGNALYLLSSTEGTLTALDLDDLSLRDHIRIGVQPARFDITPDGTHAFVLSTANMAVAIIRLPDLTLEHTVPLPNDRLGQHYTGAIAIRPNNSAAIVAGIHSLVEISSEGVARTVHLNFNLTMSAIASAHQTATIFLINGTMSGIKQLSGVDPSVHNYPQGLGGVFTIELQAGRLEVDRPSSLFRSKRRPSYPSDVSPVALVVQPDDEYAYAAHTMRFGGSSRHATHLDIVQLRRRCVFAYATLEGAARAIFIPDTGDRLYFVTTAPNLIQVFDARRKTVSDIIELPVKDVVGATYAAGSDTVYILANSGRKIVLASYPM